MKLIELENDADLEALRVASASLPVAPRSAGLHAHELTRAELSEWLRPKKVLDLGCGRGDFLELMRRLHFEIHGVELRSELIDQRWPRLRGALEVGDAAQACRRLAREGRRFDLVTAFNLFEYLTPAQVGETLDEVGPVASDAGLLFVSVAAFGTDRVFGELLPLEFEENRAAFQARGLLTHVIAQRVNPPTPSEGQLVWAHVDWWEKTFERHGWYRQTALERQMHRLDLGLPHFERAFYVLGRRSAATEARIKALLAGRAPSRRAWLTRALSTSLVERELEGGLSRALAKSAVHPALIDRARALARRLRGRG